jgi:hypothetical protein
MSAALQAIPVPSTARPKPPLTEKKAALERGKINEQAVAHMPALAKRLLPKGHVKGRYWQAALFPKGQAPMQLQVDLMNGAWCDFHNNKRGSDVQGLIGYLAKLDCLGAQAALRQMLGEG